jgi:hypothetical protein
LKISAKVGDGMTKIERSKTQNQNTKSKPMRNKAQEKNQTQQITRNFKDAGAIVRMSNHFERNRKQKQENKPRQNKRTEKIENLGKSWWWDDKD